jgi:hypothetical protein
MLNRSIRVLAGVWAVSLIVVSNCPDGAFSALRCRSDAAFLVSVNARAAATMLRWVAIRERGVRGFALVLTLMSDAPQESVNRET